MKPALLLAASIALGQTPIDLSRPSETIPFTALSDGRVTNTETVISVAPARFPAVYVATIATIEARAGSLSAGARIWIEWDPISQNRVVLGNSQVVLVALQLANIARGVNDASGFTPGRSPIAYCDGSGDQWIACTDVRSPFAPAPRINLGPGGQLTWSPDGTANLSCVLP